jgi:ABC-2 type transport system permease protein
VARGGVPLLVGALVFDLTFPSSVFGLVAFLVAVLFGILISFSLRYLVALSGSG